jgi:acyl transferase domain-containing protein
MTLSAHPTDLDLESRRISIVGMACRFPGARNMEKFWNLLVTGENAVSEVPPERFDISDNYSEIPATPGRTLSRFGGFVDDVDAFDAGFFRISPHEARTMDPQQRILLQVAWEALEDAGIPPSSRAGERTGVFVGQATADYAEVSGARASDVHRMTGSALRGVTAGRLSHCLDLRGPSIVVDTSCSSSLVAVHLARQSLLTGETDLAIVAGTNLVLTPADAISYSQADMLAADGRCKFGDADADGFVRSEGIGVLVLKRTADAVSDGDRIRASILGSAVNNDGDGNGLMLTPAESGQREVIRAACNAAGVHPADLDYLETHGTGTRAGDSTELSAIAEVLDDRRDGAEPLRLGSVKTNIGHAEAAAGIAGLIKAALVAERRTLPASLHLCTPNAVLDRTPALAVVTETTPLQPRGGHALLGVSSFGISGTNAHAIVSDLDNEPAGGEEDDDLPHVLVLSARSETSLRRLATAYADLLERSGQPVRDICHAAATGRDALPHRLWAVGTTGEELAGELRSLAAGHPTPGGGVARAEDGTTTAFVFPGQGGQWSGMGRRLLATSATFRSTVDKCDAVIREELGWSVLDRLREPGDLASVAVAQPVLWTVEVALAETLLANGIEPDVCIGHSMGEAAAAYVAGQLSLRSAAAVVCRRSRLMARVSGRGRMLATDLSPAKAQELVEREPGMWVAAENSPRSTVLAGERAATDRIIAVLERESVHHKEIKVDVASHSPLVDVLLPELRAELRDLDRPPRPHATRLLSTVRERPVTGQELSAEYWVENLRSPVHFASTVAGLAAGTPCVFLELSPHPVLLDSLPSQEGSTALATLSRREPEDVSLAKVVGRYFAAGGRVDWRRRYGGRRPRVDLPSYPWDTQSFWTSAADGRVESMRERGTLEVCRGSSLHGTSALPAVAYLDAARRAAGEASLRDVEFGGDLLDTGTAEDITLRTRIERDRFSVRATHSDGGAGHATGSLLPLSAHPLAENGNQQLDAALTRCAHVSRTELDRLAAARGYRFAPGSVRQAWRQDGTAVVLMRPTPTGVGVLENAMRALVAAWPVHDAEAATTSYAMTAVREAVIRDAPEAAELWSVAWFSPAGAVRPAQADLLVLSGSGELVAALQGITLSALPGAGDLQRTEVPAPRPAPEPTRESAVRGQSATKLVRHPELRGHTMAEPVPTLRGRSVAKPRSEPDVRGEFVRRLAELLGTEPSRVDLRLSLRDMGFDSIMATQLRRALTELTGETISTADLLKAGSAERLLHGLFAEH